MRTPTQRRALEAQVASFNRFLADFGFSPAEHVVAGVAGQAEASTLRFPGIGVGIVLSYRDAVARVLRKNEVLATIDVFGPGPSLHDGWYLADQNLLVFTWHVDEPEGCAFEGDLAGAAIANLSGK